MTRKDYILIAAAIKLSRSNFVEGSNANVAIDEVARNMAGELSRDNSKFDRTRFLKDCGARS